MYPQQQPSTIPNFFQVLVTLIHKIDDTPSYTKTQWSALVLLSFGVFLAVVGESSSSSSHNSGESITLGLAAVFTATLTSALAGVFYEKILQTTSAKVPSDVWTRNFQLSTFSLIPSLFLLKLPLFENFTPIVYCILLLQGERVKSTYYHNRTILTPVFDVFLCCLTFSSLLTFSLRRPPRRSNSKARRQRRERPRRSRQPNRRHDR